MHIDIQSLSGIRTHDPSVRASEDSSCFTARTLWSTEWRFRLYYLPKMMDITKRKRWLKVDETASELYLTGDFSVSRIEPSDSPTREIVFGEMTKAYKENRSKHCTHTMCKIESTRRYWSWGISSSPVCTMRLKQKHNIKWDRQGGVNFYKIVQYGKSWG
jgi:hypothetical protein